MNIKWKRPSGSTIETNDSQATIEQCESLGYTRVKAPAKKAAKKKAAK